MKLTLRGRRTARTIASQPEVDSHLRRNAPVAIGVSGGKDSTAVAFATIEHLDRIGHTGPRLLVHADLGVTEWADSLPTCERLAARLGVELLVVRRMQGDMMDRWEQRWRDNVARWETLSCVKLILPWSTPAMRFCTAELKVDQITRALVKRWPGQTIVNVTGVRREESAQRSKAATCKVQPKLASKTHKTVGLDWLPIADWTEADVFAIADERGFPTHEAYRKFGSSRVSCIACILGTKSDHEAAARDERNAGALLRMVRLELKSTFAFQGSRWLSDTFEERFAVARTIIDDVKAHAASREQAEARIPKHLLYTKGWPTCVPTRDEAALLAAVRFQVADAVGLRKTFVSPDEIIGRYEDLIRQKESRPNKKVTA